ncbi:MAG: hypothetical protein PGN23_17655 [Sphingomonas adhaesiva]|uniref:hypothetical protein n=1 Tax=Sphingomonas adhaesiva TaxID=28212 RepID=UPI002FF78135
MILLALAAQASAVDAERAFAATAHVKGQWTAFRRYAADDAVMFVPQAVRAQDWLKGRKDPPVSVQWQPATVFDSCDGERAVTTGPWTAEGGAHGTFTTLWVRREDGWRWIMDHGRDTPQPVAAAQAVRHVRPVCDALPTDADVDDRNRRLMSLFGGAERSEAEWYRARVALDGFADDVAVQRDDAMPTTGAPRDLPEMALPGMVVSGESQDGTLHWRSAPLKGAAGAHDLIVSQWQGRARGWRIVLYETTGVTP